MENASKALVIAGGILLAIMLLSLLAYVATSMSGMAESQERINLAKEIADFNKSFLAYNKKKLYGADVITVVNKAIHHNKSIEETAANPYYINIKILPKQTFETTVTKIDNTTQLSETYAGVRIPNEIKAEFGHTTSMYNAYLSENRIHELGNWQAGGAEFKINKDFVELFTGDTTDRSITTDDKTKTYILKSALTNFKTSIFECTDVEYNEDGKIKSMEFKQS